MAWFHTLVEHLYRQIYGPLNDERTASDCAGCGGRPAGRDGYVLVVDGVGGLNLCGTGLRYVMAAAKLPHTVELVPWGHGLGRWYADLTDVANRDLQALAMSETIRRLRQVRPVAPVFLIAKSGGAGVVVKALEQLDDQAVERVVLLAPALSPGYDLTRALGRVRRDIVVFWSPLDVFVLGLGTLVFGTIDRVKSVSAGLVGFRQPAADQADPQSSARYARLRQVRWRMAMAATGHFGGHVGPDSPVFLKKYVVPLLQTESPSLR
jgi:pimeloyl-ACP methyl ester carboxylesterase